MAVNIFDKYGIKEVANVYFEALDDDLSAGVYAGDIVLFLDSLKVSTIETTAENTAAQGGWGNPKLIQWDYGKEINITLEDALLSLESLRFMLGGAIKRSSANEPVYISRTEEVVVKADSNGKGYLPMPVDHLNTKKTLIPEAIEGYPIRFINYGGGTNSQSAGCRTQIIYDSEHSEANKMGTTADSKCYLEFVNPEMLGKDNSGNAIKAEPAPGDHIRIFWTEKVTAADDAVEVVISPDTFPGTYKVVGDTFMRSEKTGKDEAFQFIINKAKVLSEVTITLEAEGDPSTFEMQLNVLRSTGDDGNEMMKLVRYSSDGTSGNPADKDIGSIGDGL